MKFLRYFTDNFTVRYFSPSGFLLQFKKIYAKNSDTYFTIIYSFKCLNDTRCVCSYKIQKINTFKAYNTIN